MSDAFEDDQLRHSVVLVLDADVTDRQEAELHDQLLAEGDRRATEGEGDGGVVEAVGAFRSDE